MFLFTYLHTVGVKSFGHWSHTNTHTHTHTLGRNPLHEGSACCCDRHLTTCSIREGPTPMHPVEFEPTIPTSERPQTHAIDRTAKKLLKVSWSPLVPRQLKPSSPFILLVIFILIVLFYVLLVFLLLFSLCSLYVFGSSTFHLFVFHLFICSILQFPRRHTLTYKKQQTVISIISFERYTLSTKEDKGSLPKIWKKNNLENNFMKYLLTEIQCTSRWNSQFQTGAPPHAMIAKSLPWLKR